MKEIDSCLKQIAKVRMVAREEEVAYVARSRLGRLVLSLSRVVGKMSNGQIIDRPCRLIVPGDAPAEVQTLARLCNSLHETAKTLVQPSEPLDERWKAGWSELLADIDLVERQLELMTHQVSNTDRS